MPKIEIDLPLSLKQALDAEAKVSHQSTDLLITAVLSEHLKMTMHTVFQISTSGALVAGVYDKEMSVGSLLQHGNFGIGTFAGLDGEMAVLDGDVFQIKGSGQVIEANDDVGVPFAVMTYFSPDKSGIIKAITCFDDLETKCSSFRKSDNIFYAFRLHGLYKQIKTRAVNPPKPGVSFVDAANEQSEFVFNHVMGTLVGIWSPTFASEFSVQGYHFHFISDDHTRGGHVLGLEADELELQMQILNNYHLILPETERFLAADLSKDIATELNSAERSH